jgi:hypothetical protein
MFVTLMHSLSCIWGKETLIKSVNQVQAIHKLIKNPKTDVKDIDRILAKTDEAWNKVLTLLGKIQLSISVILWGEHRVSLIEACEKLKKIINKVEIAAKNTLPPMGLVEVETDEYPSDEEVPFDEPELHRHEIAVLRVRLSTLENKIGSIYRLNYELKKCEEGIKMKLENNRWIEEFDRKSIELFQMQKTLKEETKRRGFKKTKPQAAFDPKTIVLINDIENLRRAINNNLWGIKEDLKNLSVEQLKLKKVEIEGKIALRKQLEDRIKLEESKYSAASSIGLSHLV